MYEAESSGRGDSPNSVNARVLAACLAGDREQIGQLVNFYRPYLMAIARGEWRDRLQSKEGISDLVQETIIKGVQAFEEFRGSTETEFAAWLRQILVRQIQNTARRYRTNRREAGREEPLVGQSLPTDDVSPSSVLVSEETRGKLEIALSQLPPDYMEVVRLRQFENLSWEEIAAHLDRTAEAVRKLWTRAVVQLRNNLDLQSHVDHATAELP